VRTDAIAEFVQVFGAHQRGVDDVVPPRVPPHLEDVAWRFACVCGRGWGAEASARVVEGRVVPPRRQCVGNRDADLGCGRWVSGSRVIEA
jgi:hypothetical protein